MMKTLLNLVKKAVAVVKETAAKVVSFATPSALVGGSAMGLSLGSRADPVAFTIDATSIVTVITGGVTTISAIGIAVLSLVVVIKLFKWVQRVL